MESSNKSKASGFLKQGSILAIASILVRVIGLVYRIPMANIIGNEGNGIYSAAFEIYNLLLIISSYGMPMAVSKMVSAKCAKKQYKNGGFHLFFAVWNFDSTGVKAQTFLPNFSTSSSTTAFISALYLAERSSSSLVGRPLRMRRFLSLSISSIRSCFACINSSNSAG